MSTFLYQEEWDAIVDRFEGWELIEFLQVPAETILRTASEEGWINEENFEDLLDFVGLRKDNDNEDEPQD